MRSINIFLIWLFSSLLSLTALAYETELNGLTPETEANVRARVDLFRAQQQESLANWQLKQYLKTASEQIQEAVKPFGYYQSKVEIIQQTAGQEKITINVVLGEPVRVTQLQIHSEEKNTELAPPFQNWLNTWPLNKGDRLNQQLYENSKTALEKLAKQHGYFHFKWLQHRIELNLENYTAKLDLAFTTGQQAIFGETQLPVTLFHHDLLQRFLSIKPGEQYETARVDRFRDDLRNSGYFQKVSIQEQIDDATIPATVNLMVELTERTANTYSTKLGFGTDTGPRLQLGWQRHYLSQRGDRLGLGFGAQQQDQEFIFRANYQLPRGNDPGEFWFARSILSREEEDFRFEDSSSNEPIFPGLDGQRQQYQIDAGLLTEISREERWPIQQRWFLSHLFERFDALDRGDLLAEQVALLSANPLLEPNLELSQQVTALGASWSLRNSSGKNFDLQGLRANLRLSGALANVASDISFAQFYFGVRHSRLLAPRHRLLLRSEIAYTEVATRDFSISLGDRELDLSISRLPEAYRFKTGGDRTIRGYGFESLSNNRIGSNHLLTASAEYEYRIASEWSLAGFYDVGNAFNRFSDLSLRHGVGMGVRWYSLIGPVRLDIARGLDEPSEDIRIHITIGSQLF